MLGATPLPAIQRYSRFKMLTLTANTGGTSAHFFEPRLLAKCPFALFQKYRKPDLRITCLLFRIKIREMTATFIAIMEYFVLKKH